MPEPHFHKEDRISEKDLVPDGDYVSEVPTWAAPEGTEVSYLSGSTFRRYKMLLGTWRVIGTLELDTLISGAGFDIEPKFFYWNFAENAVQTVYWTSTLGGTGTNTPTLTDSFGYLISACAGVGGDSAEMNTKATLQTQTFASIIAEFQIRTTTNFAGDKVDMGIGLNPTAGQYPGFEDHSIGYIYDHVAGYCFVTKGSSATTDTGVTGLTTNVWHRLRFEITASSIKCFLDGTQIGTTHTTNLPSNTSQLALRWILGTLTGNTNVRNLQVRAVRLVMIP